MKTINNNTSRGYLLGAILIVASLIRIIPGLCSDNLFSTDVWPLYRDTLVLLSNPSLKIFNDSFFDGYNNRWPGVILSTTYYSVLTGLSPRYVYMYIFVLALSLSFMLGFYIFVKRLGKKVSWISSLAVFSFLPSMVVFTSSPLKEVYAYTLFFIIIYFFVRTLQGLGSVRDLVVAFIFSTSLLIVHHLTLFMLTGFITSILFIAYIHRLLGSGNPVIFNLRVGFLLYLYLQFSMISYFLLVGYKFMSRTLDSHYLAVYFVYAFAIYMSYLVFSNGQISLGKSVVAGLFLLVLSSIPFSRVLFYLPGISIYAYMVIWYIVPIIPATLLFVVHIGDSFMKTIVVGTGLFILLNILFVVIGAPVYSSIFHRFADYFVIPVSLLAGYVFRKTGFIYKALSLTIIFLTIVSSFAVIHNIVSYGADVSFFWYYPISETHGFDTVSRLLSGNTSIVGDEKIRYYFTPIRSVFVKPVLEALFLDKPLGRDHVLVLYRGNIVHGLAIGLNLYSVKKILDHSVLSKVYDNYYVYSFIETF